MSQNEMTSEEIDVERARLFEEKKQKYRRLEELRVQIEEKKKYLNSL